jgi:hypothetical protein
MKRNKEYIKTLIEKYFEGLTSLEEEQLLRDYFQKKNVAKEFEIYKPIFQFFSGEIQTHINKRKVTPVQWFSIFAAACLLLLFILRFTFNMQKTVSETSQAYIDGKKQTDIELIKTEALRSLENLSESNDAIYSSQIEALELFFDNN